MTTGKNKENFEKWLNTFLLNDENAHLVNTDSFGNNYSQIDIFYEYKFEMQIGVYLAYYDSLGYILNIYPIELKVGGCQDCYSIAGYGFEITIMENGFIKSIEEYDCLTKDETTWSKLRTDFKSRNEAYTEAFKKADEIANLTLK